MKAAHAESRLTEARQLVAERFARRALANTLRSIDQLYGRTQLPYVTEQIDAALTISDKLDGPPAK